MSTTEKVEISKEEEDSLATMEGDSIHSDQTDPAPWSALSIPEELHNSLFDADGTVEIDGTKKTLAELQAEAFALARPKRLRKQKPLEDGFTSSIRPVPKKPQAQKQDKKTEKGKGVGKVGEKRTKKPVKKTGEGTENKGLEGGKNKRKVSKINKNSAIVENGEIGHNDGEGKGSEDPVPKKRQRKTKKPGDVEEEGSGTISKPGKESGNKLEKDASLKVNRPKKKYSSKKEKDAKVGDVDMKSEGNDTESGTKTSHKITTVYSSSEKKNKDADKKGESVADSVVKTEEKGKDAPLLSVKQENEQKEKTSASKKSSTVPGDKPKQKCPKKKKVPTATLR